MLSGVLTPESYSEVLRSLSQKRRNGILEVTQGEHISRIMFVNGRIVEVVSQGVYPATEILSRLIRAGLVEADDDLTFNSYGVLADEVKLAPEIVVRAVKHRVLERLFSFGEETGGYYTFYTQMPEYDREFCPTISVSQLLLDLVSAETEAERVHSIFLPNLYLDQSVSPASDMSEEERIVFELLTDYHTLDDLQEKSLLSQYYFHEALLSLFESGSITLTDFADLGPSKETPIEEGQPTAVIESQMDTELRQGTEAVSTQRKSFGIQIKPAVIGDQMGLLILILGMVMIPLLYWSEIFRRF